MAKNKKILIVEDDKFMAHAYSAKLSKVGYEIEIAVDGDEAIKSVEKSVPALIILDLVMPKKDGFVFLEELKANENWKKIPVLIASNLGQQEDVDKGLLLGANDYIIKTDLVLDELVEKIQALVKG